MKGEDDRNSSNDKEKENVNSLDEASDEEEELITLDEAIDKPQTIPIRRELHAYPLALIIVITFALSIVACFLYLFLYECRFSETTELFKTVSAVLSGPLGFVLGYYFRVTETGSS